MFIFIHTLIFLGVVNTIYDALKLKSPHIALKWSNDCHVNREAYHGGTFNGNACRILLKKVDILASYCEIGGLKYVHAFRDFNAVVESCFGKHLDINFRSVIDCFIKSFIATGISVTPKVHAVFFHVKEFCEQHGTGLGNYSEQASESVHHDFSKIWGNFKLDINNISYSKNLLRSVCKYNSLHL